jgi:ribonuclease HI
MESLNDVVSVYVDGGVVIKNPSKIGGTFAWRLVNSNNQVVREGSGAILAEETGLDSVTNNLTEFLALTVGLEQLPEGWSGMVYSDSQITLGRFFEGWAMHGIPLWLVRRGSAALRRLDIPRIKWTLLGGHPTRADLLAGKRARDGKPVSEHNVFCDKACGLEAKKVLELTGVPSF